MFRKVLVAITILAIVLGCGIISFGAKAENASKTDFTLEESINYAQAHNAGLKLQELSVEKAEVSYKEAQSAADDLAKEFVTNYEMAKAKYVVPVMKKGEWELEQKKRQLEEEKLAIQVKKAYFDLQKARRDLQNARADLARERENLRLAQVRLKAGRAASAELLGVQAQVARADASLTVAENNANEKLMLFNNTLGLKLDTQVNPVSEFRELPKLPKYDLETLLMKFKEKDTTLAALEMVQIPAAEANLEQVQKYYTPNVYAYRQAKYDMERVRLSHTQYLAGLEIQVRGLLNGLRGAEKQYRVLSENMKSAQEFLRVTQLQYEAGTATQQQVRGATDDLAVQEAALSDALYTFNVIKSQLDCGILLAGDSVPSFQGGAGGTP